jgi:hypothetical protein
MTECWRPILADECGSRAMRVLADIVAAIVAGSPERESTASQQVEALAAGPPGEAILLEYVGRRAQLGGVDVSTYRQFAMARLVAAAEALRSSYSDLGLLSGFTGTAWTISHFSREGAIPSDGCAETLSAVDQALLRRLTRPWRRSYDLVSGLTGIGVYALERAPSEESRLLLNSVVSVLEAESTQCDDGVYWATRTGAACSGALRARFPEGYVDLGVAHGVAGAVGFLARAVESGTVTSRVERLLRGAASWLASVARAHGDVPAAVGEGAALGPSRLGWCYGNLGVACALLAAGNVTGEAAWSQLAEQLATTAAARTYRDSGVADAGLCHGAGGIAHLFNRLYHATGRDDYRKAAIAWLQRVLSLRTPDNGVGGYRAWDALGDSGRGQWVDDRSLLSGAAGVGLSLLSATTDIPPHWDRLLVADLPTRVEGRDP